MFLIIHGSLISEVINSQTFTEYLLCVPLFPYVSIWGLWCWGQRRDFFSWSWHPGPWLPKLANIQRKNRASSYGFLKECLLSQYVWTKYTVSLLVKTVSGKAYQICCASIKCIPVLKFCALFCAPGKISYYLLIRFPFGSYFAWLFGLPLTGSQRNLRDRTGKFKDPKMSILAVCSKLVANQGKKENQESYFWPQ